MSDAIYAEITDRIVAALKRGVAPWQRQWVGSSLPHNLFSGRAYHGVNVLLLTATEYPDPRWITFVQAKNLGGKVRRGEHGTRIVFRCPQVGLLKTHVVFNAAQVDGLGLVAIEPPAPATGGDAFARAREIAPGYQAAGGPCVIEGTDQAAYIPARDTVTVPALAQCVSPAAYYSVLFHELAHSTGHPTRLRRSGVSDLDHFGSERYSREELVAELASAFLCGASGVDPQVDNTAAYLAGWARSLRGDSTLIVRAAADAQRAADYVLGTRALEQDG